MIVHRCCDNLPEDNTYVVAHYTGGNWIDSKDQRGCEWKVVKFRECAPGFNNLLPYEWIEFGPGKLFGQDVDLWFELPRITKGVGYSLDDSGGIQLSQDWMLKDV